MKTDPSATPRFARLRSGRREEENHERPDPASLSELALLRESARGVRHQAAGVEVGRDPEHHAEARPDAADRRLSKDAGAADRRRHLLRYAAHDAGDREALAREASPARGAGRRG